MKSLAIFAIMLLGLWCILFVESLLSKKESIEFLDFNHTNILKGYGIFAVLLGHVGQYAGVNGIEYPAGVGVSLFLILSGYGITLSVQKKGMDGFWIKRFSRVFVPYILAEVVFMILRAKYISIGDVILDFALLKPLHPFGWYLHFILICYILFYIVWKIGKTDRQKVILLMGLFGVWFLLKSLVFIDEPFFLEARQMLAFPIGVAIGLRQLESRQYDSKKGSSLASIVGSTFLYALLHLPYLDNISIVLYNFMALGTCTMCALGIIGLTYSFRVLQNKGMIIVSSISFEIYIVHGYFIDIVSNSKNVWGAVEFISLTIVGSILLKYFTDIICKRRKI